MSSAPHLQVQEPSRERDSLDRYYTPRWAIEALLRRFSVQELRVLEPCDGDGAIAELLRLSGAEVVTGDLDPLVQVDRHWDFVAAVRAGEVERFDAVITNPPYTSPTTTASDVIRAALEVAPAVACLLRTSWLDVTDEREELLVTHPPTHIISLPRVGFRAPGEQVESSGSQYPSAWFLWWKAGKGVLPPISAVPKVERYRHVIGQGSLF